MKILKKAKLIAEVNNFKLYQKENFYYIVYPEGQTAVNTSGTRQEILAELKRWKKEVDSNNPFMLEVENEFIRKLEGIK